MLDEYERALSAWSAGERDRELALRLAFLAWYSCSEPQELSGMVGVQPPDSLARETFDYLGGTEGDDDVLFVFATMAEVASWCLGGVETENWWERTGAACRDALGGRVPAASSFAGRGSFGDYFAHHAQSAT